MEPQCVADVEGPWQDPNFESGLMERCRRYWATPISELPDLALATYLEQRFAPQLMIAEARKRLAEKRLDDSEFFDGQLAEALERAVSHL